MKKEDAIGNVEWAIVNFKEIFRCASDHLNGK